MSQGVNAFDFKWKNNNDQIQNLSDYQGKYVLLNFTSTACAPCWNTYEEMNILQETHKDEVKIIYIHIDDNEEAWHRIAKTKNIDFRCTSLWNINSKKETLAVYKVVALPTFLLIDKNGVIADRWAGKLNSKKIIKKL